MRIYSFLLILSCFTCPLYSSAASFDCKKLTTKLEKTICSSLELSEEDERLSEVYKGALHKSKDKEGLIKSQKEWLRRRNTEKREFMLLALYKDRIIELGDPINVPVRSVSSGCDGFLKRNSIDDISECRVSSHGTIGKVDGKTFLYALYCIIPNGYEGKKCVANSDVSGKGVSVFVQDGASNEAKILLERGSIDLGLNNYYKPTIVQNSYGKIMHIPIELDGTGVGNESNYYLWEDDSKKWKLLNSTYWLDELSKHIPKGAYVGSGVWPNISTMSVKIHLFRGGEPNCCPEGGVALVKLSISNGRFEIKSVKMVKE